MLPFESDPSTVLAEAEAITDEVHAEREAGRAQEAGTVKTKPAAKKSAAAKAKKS